MYMDDMKLFAKNEKELDTQIQAVEIYSQDIGMEFDIEKCVMQVMKSEKQYMTEEMEQPNQEKNQNATYLGILEADTIKQVEMKEEKN